MISPSFGGKPGECAVCPEQFLAGPLLDDSPVFYDDDAVHIAHPVESVRCKEHELAVHEPEHRLLEGELRLDVEMRRGLVEHEHVAPLV